MKPLLSGHLRDLPKCPLNRGCPLVKIAQCLLTINFQRLLCTVINFQCVKEAKEAKEAVLYFVQDLRSNLHFIDN